MRTAKLFHPTYTENFRCINSACEDSCCKSWTIPVDKATIEKYQSLPASPLHTLIDASIVLAPPGPQGEDSSRPAIFATIRTNESHECALLSEERLCSIQVAYGGALLPSTCATYPRIVRLIGNREEKALTLSCPEAARLVLLNPELLSPSHQTITEPFYGQLHAGGCPAHDHAGTAHALQPWFWSIRESVFTLIRNRAYPLWQRLFLLGVFCRQLDELPRGETEHLVPKFLRDFEAQVAAGTPRSALETLPVEPTLQLDIVLRLAGMLLNRSNVNPRFAECVKFFTVGIGNGPSATLESLASNYALAHDRFYAPFFDSHPYILENYLINTIFRFQFPFGCDGMETGETPSLSREYAMLTAQFALMKGLLIGVAGYHGDAFSTDHVVHTFQSASKHFDHHAEFLNDVHALLVESQMDGARGSLILLKNTEPVAPTPGVPA
ncbi:MAG: flagellin lysine-N-methylase [Terriglobales bacterium]